MTEKKQLNKVLFCDTGELLPVKQGGVYKIQNTSNNRFYIGSTKDFKHRYWSHKHDLQKKKHHNRFLQNDWNLHKEEDFVFSVVQVVSEADNRLTAEQEWLDKLFESVLCYNHKQYTNEAPRETWSFDKEATIKKASEARKKNWETYAYRAHHMARINKQAEKLVKTYDFINPAGEPISITNISKFCRDNPEYDKQGFFQVALEKKKSYKGYIKANPKTDRIKNMKPFGAKEWLFKSPEGELIKIENLLKHCRENNLTQSCMNEVHSGKARSHKRWTKG